MVRWQVIALLGVVACESDIDSDSDGLSNAEEAALGTNPNAADTDGDGLNDGVEVNQTLTDPLLADTDDDGLTDGEEINDSRTDPLDPDMDKDGLTDGEEVNKYGTKPRKKDTDDDGYLDPDEIAEGSDPLDPESWIYRGYWPYNSDKDTLNAPGPVAGQVTVGSIFPRVVARDQYGDDVELYDFAQPDTLVVVDGASFGSDDSRNVAQWLGGTGDPGGLDTLNGAVKSAVERGDVWWTIYVTEGAGGVRPAPRSDVRSFADQVRGVCPVMEDAKLQVLNAVNAAPTGLEIPLYAVMDGATMEVLHVGDLTATLSYVRDAL